MRQLDINGAGLRSKKELETRIVKAIKKISNVVYGKLRKKVQDQEEGKGEENGTTL